MNIKQPTDRLTLSQMLALFKAANPGKAGEEDAQGFFEGFTDRNILEGKGGHSRGFWTCHRLGKAARERGAHAPTQTRRSA